MFTEKGQGGGAGEGTHLKPLIPFSRHPAISKSGQAGRCAPASCFKVSEEMSSYLNREVQASSSFSGVVWPIGTAMLAKLGAHYIAGTVLYPRPSFL